MSRRHLLLLLLVAPLGADPAWTAPATLAFGTHGTLELRESDPARPPLPRPAEDKLGPLLVRAAAPTEDGRGWKLTVQAIRPGITVVPPLDLGDGRVAPELRLEVPRTTPYGAPWKGVGGGREDQLPPAPFPWLWALLATALVVSPLAGLLHAWRRQAPGRRRTRARHAFAAAWPPRSQDRPTLDEIHQKGRDLLAAFLGEEARAWGAQELARRHCQPWAMWVQEMDAARFGQSRPGNIPLQDLLACLKEAR